MNLQKKTCPVCGGVGQTEIQSGPYYRPCEACEGKGYNMVDVPRLVRPEFVERMEAELHANNRKGDWTTWTPPVLTALSELSHHQAKLVQALEQGYRKDISEYSADIANIVMKIEEIFGETGVSK